MSIINVLSQLGSNLDKILIWHFMGPLAVASFSIAQISSRYASGVFNNVAAIALPKVSKRNFTELQKTLPRKVAIFSSAMGVVALIYIAVVPILFQFIFPDYPESVLVAQILSILFILVPNKIFSQALIVHNYIGIQYFLTIATYSALVIFLWISIPAYGIIGATTSIVAANVLATLLNFTLFKLVKQREV